VLRFAKKLIDTGVHDLPDHYQRRTTRFVNLFSLMMMAGLIVGFTNIFFLLGDYPYLHELVAFVLSVLCLVLNSKGYYMTATYLFLFSLNYAIFYISEYYDISTGTYLFYFPVILCVALLHNPKRGIKHTLIFFAISFAFMGLSVFIDFDFIRNYNVSAENNVLLFQYNLCISIVVSIVMVVLVIQVIDSQNYQLMHALKQETSNQEKISQSLKEKEVMLSELHHRVKNNMSVISSLLNLQISSTPNTEAKRLLTESRNRVVSMSLVHDKLYQKKDFSKISFDSYLRELVTELVRASPDRVDTQFALEPCEIDISVAIPVGLVVNEMVTNSIKHAFKNLPIEARVSVNLHTEGGKKILEVCDNGKGFDYDTGKAAGSSLGLFLVESLVEQVDGTLSYGQENGSRYVLVF
jgi:two-component sensor histidine kinase